ncbi:hypothetical protein GCM10009099_40360 [Caenispirillum bisanense]
MKIGFRFDNREAIRQLRQLPKQTQFAVALALTRTAKDAQAEVIKSLGQKFTIRTAWVSKGIRIKPATKQKLEAVVFSKDDFMALQETGGEKTARDGKAIARPYGARKKAGAVTRPSKWPGQMLTQPSFFLGPISTQGKYATAETASRAGGPARFAKRSPHNIHSPKRFSRSQFMFRGYGQVPMVVWLRDGAKTIPTKGRYKGMKKRNGEPIKRQPIKLMWVLDDSVPVKPRFEMRKTVEETALDNFALHFQKALVEALKTER